jgi:Putative peptidoglycan binding domain
MVDLAQDVQRHLPVTAGGLRVPGGVAGVTEEGERLSLGEPVTVLAERVDGLLKTGDGLGAVAKEVVSLAEGTQRVGHAVSIAGLAKSGQSLLATGEGGLVVTEVSVVPANVVEGSGLAAQVTGRAVQVERLLGLAERIGVALLDAQGDTHIDMGTGFVAAVTGFPESRDRAGEVGLTFLKRPQKGIHAAKPAVHVSLPGRVPGPQRGIESGALRADDGIFGANTEHAVECFQNQHNLSPDGTVGSGTWAALQKTLTADPPDGNWYYYQTSEYDDPGFVGFREWGPSGRWYVIDLAGNWAAMST